MHILLLENSCKDFIFRINYEVLLKLFSNSECHFVFLVTAAATKVRKYLRVKFSSFTELKISDPLTRYHHMSFNKVNNFSQRDYMKQISF